MVKTVELGSLGSVCVGGTPSRSHPEYFDGDIPWVTSTALGPLAIGGGDATQLLSDAGVRNSSTKRIPVGSLLIGIRVGVGKSSIVNDEICINQDILALTNIDDEAVFLPYLKFAIDSHSNWFAENKRGATIKGVTSKEVAKLMIPLPAVCRQKSVVRKLLTLDAVQCLLHSELRAFEQLVQSRFIEVFGDYEADAALSENSEIVGGLTKNSKRKDLPLIMPYLRVANVLFDKLDLAEITKIGVTEKEAKDKLLKRGDVLFVEGNGSQDQIGRVAMWDGSLEPMLHQNHLIRVRANQDVLLPGFILHYFMSPAGRRQILDAAVSTSGLFTLSTGKIGKFKCPIPPLALQQRFAAFAAEVDKSKFAVQQEIEKLETLKQSLMQKYFA